MGACVSLNAKPLRKINNRTKAPIENGSIHPRSSFKAATRFSRLITVVRDSSGNDINGRYEFGKELGRGEFGVTYSCIDRNTGENVACKMISKSKLKSEIDIEDVRREVEIMRHLPPHPNIVRYKDVFEDKEAVYLVMELCKGGELFDRIVSRGHYTERGAATVTKTILEIIQVCHKHGVIHRDLKPENFLYADNCEESPLKAIDFGLSIFFEEGQSFSEIVGSPYYMAPEVLRRNYGPEVDVWSAGVILYILLCGVPPFWADSEEGIAQAIVRCEIDFERDPWPKVSEDAKSLVRGMLDPNPYSRMTLEEALEHSWIRDAHLVRNISLGDNVRMRIKQFSLMNKFKKKVLRVVADNLTQEQVAGIKQMFEMMDSDNNGSLCFQELKNGLNKIGDPVSDHDVQLLIDAADLDGDGMIDCNEFMAMSVHMKEMSSDDEQLRRAFRYFDKDGSGYIEFEELRQGLFEEHEDNRSPHNEKIVHDIIFDVDLDKDGRISYEEFEAMMTTGVEWRMASRQYSRAMLNALSQRLFTDKPVQKALICEKSDQ